MKPNMRLFFLSILLLTISLTISAQTTEFTYQGSLTNSGVAANGNYDFEFALFDAASGGAQIGSTLTRSTVAVADGNFTVNLDFGAIFPGASRYLEIRIRSAGGGAFTPLTPRQPVNSTPYAVKSLAADTAASATNATNALNAQNAATAGNATQLNGQVAAFYQNATNLSSGTIADGRLTSNVALLNTAQTFGAGKTFLTAPSFTAAGSPFSVTSSTLVTNLNADRLDGLDSTSFLQSVPNPLTLSGSNASPIISGTNANGTGVYGQSSSGSGRGVYGSGGYGVYGQSSSAYGYGVYGSATATTNYNYGGYFSSAGVGGYGVFAATTATSGTTYGVYGTSASTAGTGVFGRAEASTGTTYGVQGYGVYSSSYGVYSAGRFGASGTKAFRIDHPDDPENKYLLHYSIESPEVLNAYRGTVVLDATGEATVELPPYFAKINRSPSYQLTAVGKPMPMLYVADEINEAAMTAGANAGPGEAAPKCTFRIAGGAPGEKVSWRVEAVRNDHWVRTNGAAVEVEKQGVEKGTYQHPELYGQPKEKGMNYDAAKERPEPVRRP